MSAPELEVLTPQTLPDFLTSETAVLVLTKRECAACAAWGESLGAFLAEEGEAWSHVRFGKLVLDQPGLGFFKKGTPWLPEVQDLPYNVIYHHGEVVRRYVGPGTDRLVNRLSRLAA